MENEREKKRAHICIKIKRNFFKCKFDYFKI